MKILHFPVVIKVSRTTNFIGSFCTTKLCRARVHCCYCLNIIFSANPVRRSKELHDDPNFLAQYRLKTFIIHQTHYEKSNWSRAFNQFTIACELDMINAISAADIAFIMSSSTSAWLLSPLECQKQNG